MNDRSLLFSYKLLKMNLKQKHFEKI